MHNDITQEKINKKSRIVLARGIGKKISGKKPALLFSTTQVEEIMPAIDISAIPFAPDHLLGVCLWRKQILPVVDTCMLYGFKTPIIPDDECYVVVKTAGEIEGKKQLLQGVLRISKQIVTKEIPPSCSPADIQSLAIDKDIIKGVFEYQDDLMIVPDLASIFCSI